MTDADKLDDALLDLGNGVANLFEQDMKCNFTDGHGHALAMNKAVWDMKHALLKAIAVRKELGRPGT